MAQISNDPNIITYSVLADNSIESYIYHKIKNGARFSIAVFPGNGGSVSVQYSLDKPSDVTGGGYAGWLTWEPGEVTEASARAFNSMVTHIKINAITAAATATLLIED